jgi:hypothetical protein
MDGFLFPGKRNVENFPLSLQQGPVIPFHLSKV